jgi:hypothetical protein
MGADENYDLAEEAIRGHRAVIDDVVSTLRQAWESGDDPVLYLQGIATAYEQQPAFATGGPGAAMFTICAQMLLECRLELEVSAESVEILTDPQGYLEAPLAIEGLAEPCCGSHGPMCGISSDPCCDRCPAQVGL